MVAKNHNVRRSQKAAEELERLQCENADLRAQLAGISSVDTTPSSIGEETPSSEPSSSSIVSGEVAQPHGIEAVCSYADCINPAICTVTCSRRPPPSFPRTYIPNEDIWAAHYCQNCANFWCEAGDKFAIRNELCELVL
jgi:hypothetical protein